MIVTSLTCRTNNHTIPHSFALSTHNTQGGGFLARSWGDGSVTQELHHRSFDLHEELAAEWNLASYRKLPVLSVQPGSSEFKKNNSTPNWLDGLGGTTSRMGDGSDTAQVSPFEFTSEALLRSNAAVLTSSTVSSISTSSNGDEVTSVELTSGESIECDGVVGENLHFGFDYKHTSYPNESLHGSVELLGLLLVPDNHGAHGGHQINFNRLASPFQFRRGRFILRGR